MHIKVIGGLLLAINPIAGLKCHSYGVSFFIRLCMRFFLKTFYDTVECKLLASAAQNTHTKYEARDELPLDTFRNVTIVELCQRIFNLFLYRVRICVSMILNFDAKSILPSVELKVLMNFFVLIKSSSLKMLLPNPVRMKRNACMSC